MKKNGVSEAAAAEDSDKFFVLTERGRKLLTIAALSLVLLAAAAILLLGITIFNIIFVTMAGRLRQASAIRHETEYNVMSTGSSLPWNRWERQRRPSCRASGSTGTDSPFSDTSLPET